MSCLCMHHNVQMLSTSSSAAVSEKLRIIRGSTNSRCGKDEKYEKYEKYPLTYEMLNFMRKTNVKTSNGYRTRASTDTQDACIQTESSNVCVTMCDKIVQTEKTKCCIIS